MGWCGYGIYDGDGTQTRHLDFLEWAKVKLMDDEIYGVDNDDNRSILSYKGTKLPEQYLKIFKKNIKLVLSKMPKTRLYDDNFDRNNKAIEWQMLLALFVDNKLKAPKIVFDNGIEATKYLMGDHASDFDQPGIRRRYLKKFITKAEKNQGRKIKPLEK